MLKQSEELTLEQFHRKLGQFDLTKASKLPSRIGLSFSKTIKTITLRPENIEVD